MLGLELAEWTSHEGCQLPLKATVQGSKVGWAAETRVVAPALATRAHGPANLGLYGSERAYMCMRATRRCRRAFDSRDRYGRGEHEGSGRAVE